MKVKHFIFMACILLGALLLPSCLDDDNSDWNKLYPNALVTVKHASDETVFCSWTIKRHCFPSI